MSSLWKGLSNGLREKLSQSVSPKLKLRVSLVQEKNSVCPPVEEYNQVPDCRVSLLSVPWLLWHSVFPKPQNCSQFLTGLVPSSHNISEPAKSTCGEFGFHHELTTLFQGSELNHLDLEEPESRWEIKSQRWRNLYLSRSVISHIPSADERKVILLPGLMCPDSRPDCLHWNISL